MMQTGGTRGEGCCPACSRLPFLNSGPRFPVQRPARTLSPTPSVPQGLASIAGCLPAGLQAKSQQGGSLLWLEEAGKMAQNNGHELKKALHPGPQEGDLGSPRAQLPPGLWVDAERQSCYAERQSCLRSQPGPQWGVHASSAMSPAVTLTPPVSLKAGMMSTETFSGEELWFLLQTPWDTSLHPGLQAQRHRPHHLPRLSRKDSPSWNTALCSCSISLQHSPSIRGAF